jgi:D-glycero-D-manno-heptose 1,7-bisphosphate phosphatase
MLYIFDKDGTLVGGVGNRPANSPVEQEPLPGVVEKLAQLRNAGHALAIATNQGGVAWGFISLSQAYRLAWDAAEKVGGMDAVSVCPYDARARGENARQQYARPSRRRKPDPGMIIDLARRLGYDLGDVAFVGDRESDRQAAEAAGVEFYWANDFFGGCYESS